MRTLILTFAFFTSFSILLLAQNGDWSALGIGLNGDCHSITMDAEGNLYAGGDFTLAITAVGNYAEADNIAKWDGLSWHALGKGLDGPVYDVLVDEEAGYLYATGDFSKAYNDNGTFWTVNNIARWNFNTWKWEAMGDGLSGLLNTRGHALALGPDGKLYVGGEFSQAGGQTAHNIAVWDGNSWSYPFGLGTDGPVWTLSFDSNGNLYVGGLFNFAGEIPVLSIALWNGSSWSALSGSDALDGARFETISIDEEDNLYAGGFFYLGGQTESQNIAKWDGNQWYSMGSGLNGTCFTTAIDQQGHLYIGGDFTGVNANSNPLLRIAYWNGIWHPLQSGLGTDDPNDWHWCKDLFIAPSGEVFAAGRFYIAGGIAVSNIAKWTPQTVSTSSPQKTAQDIKLFPQPANDRLQVEIDPTWILDEPVHISIFNLQGKQLFEIAGQASSYEIPLERLAPGMYLLQTRTPQGRITKSFVKH